MRLLSNPLDCSPPGSFCPPAFPSKNIGMGCFLLQGIFLTQGLNPCLLPWQEGSLPLSHLQSPRRSSWGLLILLLISLSPFLFLSWGGKKGSREIINLVVTTHQPHVQEYSRLQLVQLCELAGDVRGKSFLVFISAEVTTREFSRLGWQS